MRKLLISLHTLLAAFFLPMGIMYAITGGLYGLGLKGSYETERHTIELSAPADRELSTLVSLAESELAARDVAVPSGSAGVKSAGTSWYFEWTGSRRDVRLVPTESARELTLEIKNTDPHRFFVQLHKAKGGTAFKWFAAVWMGGLVLLFVSGGMMALSVKAFRPLAIWSTIAGTVVFAAMAFLN
ncbi:MAG: hypothetical protein AB8G96_03865 [Phycisphaerales bacterium]